MGRDPPVEVKRALRAEVGKVCPVPGCPSPYLSYHHFDPPWRDKEHHDPNGMIALCLPHHKHADVGTYTIAQLRAMKTAQRDHQTVSGAFSWRRERAVFRAGGTVFLDCPVVLRVGRRNMIWLSKSDDGADLFNLDLFSADGALVFSMRDNDWTAHPALEDIEAPPSARRLAVRSVRHGVALDLSFQEISATDFQQLTGETPPAGETLICEMTGRLVWPLEIQLTAGRIVLPGNNVIAGGQMIRCAWESASARGDRPLRRPRPQTR